MLIDFHTHVFPDKIAQSTIGALASNSGSTPHTDGTVQGMLDAADRASADICITLPVLTKHTQFESVSNFAVSLNERFKGKKIISFAGIHPDCDNIEEKLAYLKSVGIKGVKIHPDYQSTYIDDEKYVKIVSEAKKQDLIVVTHAGVDDGYVGKPVMCPPERALKLIERVGHSKLVLAHYGGHKQWKDVLDILAGQDVYFDTAFTLHEIDEKTFKDILNKHGDDKVLFATDCPWRDILDDYKIIKSFNLGKETEEKIFYKNAIKLLNI